MDRFENILIPEKVLAPSFVGRPLTVLLRAVLRATSVDKLVDKAVLRVTSVDKLVDKAVLRLVSVDKSDDRPVLRLVSVDKAVDRPVTVEESAFDAIELVNVVDKLALFPNASEISYNVSNAAGAPPTKAVIFVSIRLFTVPISVPEELILVNIPAIVVLRLVSAVVALLVSVDKSDDRVVTVEKLAFDAIELVNVVYKLPSSFNAFEISYNVSNAAGAPPTKVFIFVST